MEIQGQNNKEVLISELNSFENNSAFASDMAKLVNFEGQLVPHNSIPQGSLYIGGVWYSSPEKMPEDIREKYNAVYSGWKNLTNVANKADKKSFIFLLNITLTMIGDTYGCYNWSIWCC